jgi:hypothetical protein
MKMDRAVAMRKTAVLFGGIVLIMLALIVANAMSFEYSRPPAALDADTRT